MPLDLRYVELVGGTVTVPAAMLRASIEVECAAVREEIFSRALTEDPQGALPHRTLRLRREDSGPDAPTS
jgi:hypothetical protein